MIRVSRYSWGCLLGAFLLAVMPLPPLAVAETGSNVVSALLERFVQSRAASFGKRTRVGIAVADASTGQTLFSYRGKELLTPASVLKLITTVAALKVLGAQYTFPTEIFVDRMPQEAGDGYVGNLYVRGYGDPTITDDTMRSMALALQKQGVRQVKSVVVDDTLFVDPPGPTGPRPFQAGLSATALNDNCFVVDIAPAAVGSRAHVHVSKGAASETINEVTTVRGAGNKIMLSHSVSETPASKEDHGPFISLSDLAVKVVVRGTIGVDSAPLSYQQTTKHPAAYYGSVFKASLESEGISVSGELLKGETPSAAKRLRIFDSEVLASIIRDLNHFSNNFIAGQILYALGQDSVGLFRQDRGVERVGAFLESIGIPKSDFEIYDGSGLDKRNRITADLLVGVLVYAYRDFSVAPDLIASLSRFGHSGTLRRRILMGRAMLKSADEDLESRVEGVWGKTGTLDGVSALSGYGEGQDRRRFAFTVIVNGQSKGFAKSIENEVVKMLVGIKH